MLELRELGSFGSWHDAIRGLGHVRTRCPLPLRVFFELFLEWRFRWQYTVEKLHIDLGDGGKWTELGGLVEGGPPH